MPWSTALFNSVGEKSRLVLIFHLVCDGTQALQLVFGGMKILMSDPANESVPQLEDSIIEQKQIDGLSRGRWERTKGKIFKANCSEERIRRMILMWAIVIMELLNQSHSPHQSNIHQLSGEAKH